MNRDCAELLGGADTANVAVALASPAEDTVIVAVPAVVGVKLDVARPLDGVSGEAGLKEPDTPLTANAMGLVALGTVAPLASWMVAV